MAKEKQEQEEGVRREGNGKIKKRLVLDAKESGVSGASTKAENVVLPRALDLILDVLEIMAKNPEVDHSDLLEFFIIDFRDAFWQIPIRPEERKFYLELRFVCRFMNL